jgi:hypothetical protein
LSWEYFKPENHGLVGVADLDWLAGEGCYEWETTSVLYHSKTETFYWERGAGCSCNGPLEDVDSLDDLESGTFFDLASALSEDLIAFLKNEHRSFRQKEAVSGEVVRVIEAALKVKQA